jgi:poly-gamma-glutamate biosynthesis protein PgsC/CapC
LALIVGVIVSSLLYERFQVTAGGAIVPAYLALTLPDPLRAAMTVLIACATYYIVNVLLAKRMILYGRRKFEVEVLVGLALIGVLSLVGALWGDRHPDVYALSGVGMVLPGVLAHDMFRQRPRRTLLTLAATSAIVAAIIYIFESLMVISSLPREATSAIEPLFGDRGFPMSLLVPATFFGILAGLVLYDRTGIRSGGFVTGTYLALAVTHPWDIAFVLATATVTTLIVGRLLVPRLLLFGRRKLATNLLVGSTLAWAGLIVIELATDHNVSLWHGFVIVPLLLPSLIANDAQGQGLLKTIAGASIVAVAVLATTNLLHLLQQRL